MKASEFESVKDAKKAAEHQLAYYRKMMGYKLSGEDKVFLKRYLVMDCSYLIGNAFFSTEDDAMEHAREMRKKHPYLPIKVYELIDE